MANYESIVGRYLNLSVGGIPYRIYVEEAGQGIPLLCLHTAAADTRQYRHVLTDPKILDRFRVIAFDMPYHGKSNPPDAWWQRKYTLTSAHYVALIREVWKALGLERPVVMGCSMGGAIVLTLAEIGRAHV
jgi:pimeloyl-ACP methyl ester carboxylesterase